MIWPDVFLNGRPGWRLLVIKPRRQFHLAAGRTIFLKNGARLFCLLFFFLRQDEAGDDRPVYKKVAVVEEAEAAANTPDRSGRIGR